MNTFIAMSLGAAALNVISAILLLCAAVMVRKVGRANTEIVKRLREMVRPPQ